MIADLRVPDSVSTMSAVFPSMPSHDPCDPDREGFAHVRIEGDNVILELAAGHVVMIPGATIKKGGVILRPGSDEMVNKVQLTLLASEMSYADDNLDDVDVEPASTTLRGNRYRRHLHEAAEHIRKERGA